MQNYVKKNKNIFVRHYFSNNYSWWTGTHVTGNDKLKFRWQQKFPLVEFL